MRVGERIPGPGEDAPVPEAERSFRILPGTPFPVTRRRPPWPRRPRTSPSAPSTPPTSAATSPASTTWACGGWATTGTRRASARRGWPRPASCTSCSTRARPAAGASTWSPPPPRSRRSRSRLDGWRDVVGEWGSVHWLRDCASACRTRARSRRASSARRGRRGLALELALLGPGHLDGVLRRRVARDDVVGRLVVGEVDDDVRLARRDVEQVAGLDLEGLLEVLAPVDGDPARRACRGRSRSWRGSAGASGRPAARGTSPCRCSWPRSWPARAPSPPRMPRGTSCSAPGLTIFIAPPPPGRGDRSQATASAGRRRGRRRPARDGCRARSARRAGRRRGSGSAPGRRR